MVLAVLALSVALLGGLFFGPFKSRAVPLFWMLIEKIFARMAEKSFNPERSSGSLAFRGGLLTLLIVLVSFIVGMSLFGLKFAYPAYFIVDFVSLLACLSSGTVMLLIFFMRKSLTGKSDPKSFFMAARTFRLDLSKSDAHGTARIVAEQCLVAFERMTVIPAVAYMAGGIPLLYLASGIAAASWLYGRAGHGGGFETLTGLLQRVIGLVSGTISAFLVVLSAFLVPTASIGRAVQGLLDFKNRPSYLEGGAALAAAAYALKVTFGGTRRDIEDVAIKLPWFGPNQASAKFEPEALKRVEYMLFTLHLLLIGVTLFSAIFLVRTFDVI
ncbi:MAG: hypothetical protein AB7E85_08475 [Pseudobdellovibrionaceae bacterium]